MIPLGAVDDVGLLEELVAIPSPSGAEDVFAERLAERMAALGFRVWRDEVGNVVGEVGNPDAGQTVVLLGHMDTVPGHIPVRREAGRLYGRGAVDAKGPLAAFVLAGARAAGELGDLRVVVIGAVEEEARSLGAHHLARTMSPPDGAIIGEPGGWQGITLGYKGALHVDYHLTKPAGHGAGDRSTPAEAAVAFWNELARLALERNGVRRPPRFDTLDPTLRSISTSGDGLEDRIDMTIGLRLPPGADAESLKSALVERCGEAQLTFPYSEPPFRAANNQSHIHI